MVHKSKSDINLEQYNDMKEIYKVAMAPTIVCSAVLPGTNQVR